MDQETQSQPMRVPSPTPTEVYDPEPEAILEDLQRLSIKVRDFAYPNPTLSPAQSGTSTAASSPSLSSLPAPRYSYAAAEIFDQYKGIAELEFRLRQTPRAYPIQGKTLRRLLDIGWLPMDEAKERLHQMDWEAMKEYDAQASDYPWRPCKWSKLPDAAEREELLVTRGGYFIGLDRVRWHMEALAEREANERVMVERAQERMRLFEEQRLAGILHTAAELSTEDGETFIETLEFLPASKKRALERSASTPSYPTVCDPSSSFFATDGPKRARLDGQASALDSAATQPRNEAPTPPSKQYPAPLSTYDPALYPDAASVIKDRAPPPTPPPREDTPPLDDGETGTGSPRPGRPLQRRRKALKRSLSRQQTITQL